MRVTRGIERAAGDFDLEVTERWPARETPWPILPGLRCQVLLHRELAITGYVDAFEPTFDGTTHRLRVRGRSRTCDLVDCSVALRGGQFAGQTVLQIAETLARPFGIRVEVAAPVGEPIPDIQLQQGESCFEIIERVCRMRALLASDTPAGALILTRAGRKRASGALHQGVNIVAASGSLDWAERFSHVVVKGQSAGTDDLFGEDASQIQAERADPAVARFRPKVVVAEGMADLSRAEKRAEWEVLRRGGKATSARITVQGWNQPDGRLWTPNEIVRINAQWLQIDAELLVGEVTYRLDNNGARTELSVAPAEAFSPNPEDFRRADTIWRDVRAARPPRPTVDEADLHR
ncbi:MAG: hypothetical protein HY057_11230 [Rhodospirillales bacterium]|nr:hypothetical protein [Rhodospirillales bacterium]